jgi:hypothetical protein
MTTRFKGFAFTILFIGSLLAGTEATAQAFLDIEGGLVLGTPYNTVRIPNQGGTTFDLAEGFKPNPTLFYRIRPGVTVARRHTFTALYAPLTVEYKGNFRETVNYNGVLFPASQPITARYTFNSYRLTYRYQVVDGLKWQVGVGFTGKIRDANIAIRSADRVTNFANVGFVPLLNFRLNYQPTQKLGILLEGDALGAKQGRAEDIFLGMTYGISDKLRLKGGYRVVEGGANVGDVYNFTWINYGSLGLVWGQWK